MGLPTLGRLGLVPFPGLTGRPVTGLPTFGRPGFTPPGFGLGRTLPPALGRFEGLGYFTSPGLIDGRGLGRALGRVEGRVLGLVAGLAVALDEDLERVVLALPLD